MSQLAHGRVGRQHGAAGSAATGHATQPHSVCPQLRWRCPVPAVPASMAAWPNVPPQVLTQAAPAAAAPCSSSSSSSTAGVAGDSSIAARHRAPSAALKSPPPAHHVDAPSSNSSSSSSISWSSRLAFERLYQLSPVLGSSDAGISSHLWSRGLFLVSVDDKPKTTQPGGTKGPGGEKSPDYYANVGDAIRTLREDIPLLFKEDLHYDIYRDDIVFRDPRNSFAGIKNYSLIFWSLRFHGRIFFKQLYVEVRRIWQPSDGVICMRWTVHGVPRVPWEAEGTFDGISQYKLDSEGKIYEHAVDNVILRDPPVQGMPLLAGLNLVPGAPQQPCPGAWFRGLEERATAAASAVNAAADTLGSTWHLLYATLVHTMQLQAADQLVPAAVVAGGAHAPPAGADAPMPCGQQ